VDRRNARSFIKVSTALFASPRLTTTARVHEDSAWQVTLTKTRGARCFIDPRGGAKRSYKNLRVDIGRSRGRRRLSVGGDRWYAIQMAPCSLALVSALALFLSGCHWIFPFDYDPPGSNGPSDATTDLATDAQPGQDLARDLLDNGQPWSEAAPPDGPSSEGGALDTGKLDTSTPSDAGKSDTGSAVLCAACSVGASTCSAKCGSGLSLTCSKAGTTVKCLCNGPTDWTVCYAETDFFKGCSLACEAAKLEAKCLTLLAKSCKP
jgi:hypothetical protein